MIKLINLTKRYKKCVLDNINLELSLGNIYVLKGISGSGKTTLLNILSGLDLDYEGSVLINGKELKEIPEYRNNFGYVMQKSCLFKNLTIKENLSFIEDNEDKINNYIKMFKLENILNKYPTNISGGERQRIALIRALLNDKNVLILDEPTSSLDRKNSLVFVDYLKKIDIKDKIIIIATHKDIYDDIANSIINIEYGKTKIIKDNTKGNNKEIEEVKKNKLNSKYIFKNKKSLGIIFSLIFSIFIIAILTLLAIKTNYKTEYINSKLKIYPFDIIDVPINYELTDVKDIVESSSKTYDLYFIKKDNYNIYSLINEEDTVFKNNINIVKGTFPKNSNEVLVNEEYALFFLGEYSLEDIIGKKIIVENKEYIISGINNGDYKVYLPYYSKSVKDGDTIIPTVFINDKEIFNNTKNVRKLMKIDKKYFEEIYYRDTKDALGEAYTEWVQLIRNLFNDTKHISNVCLIIVGCLSVLVLLFLTNQISLELFYKRKEFGYLQIFGFNKKQVKYIYLLEYLLSIGFILFISVLIYLLIMLFIYIKYNYNFFLNIWLLLLIMLFIIGYSILIIIRPINKILKKDIINMIK